MRIYYGRLFIWVFLVPQEEVPLVVLSDNNLGIKLVAQAQVPKQIMPGIHALFTLYSDSRGFGSHEC